MARNKKHEEHENHERWLVSYADFITLLFAFFVVMYSVSSVNEGKFRVLSESMVAAFRSPAKSLHPIQVGIPAKSPYQDPTSVRHVPASVALPKMPVPRAPRAKNASGAAGSGVEHAARDSADGKAERDLENIAKEVQRAMAPLIHEGLIRIRQSRDWVEIEINTEILFSSGSATLEPGAHGIVAKIAEVIQPFPNAVQVEGFTDNVPISSAVYRSNWELSAGRAASVVHLFANLAVAPERMVAMGYGEFRPQEDNATEVGRSRNRRVLVVVRSAGRSAARSAEGSDGLNQDTPGAPSEIAQDVGNQAAVVPRVQAPRVISSPIRLPF